MCGGDLCGGGDSIAGWVLDGLSWRLLLHVVGRGCPAAGADNKKYRKHYFVLCVQKQQLRLEIKRERDDEVHTRRRLKTQCATAATADGSVFSVVVVGSGQGSQNVN